MTENQRQERAGLRTVNRAVPKKDSMQLLLGKPVYTDDVAPKDALVVKILRSPHANAIVEEIDTAAALKIPGVAAVYTWRDVPQTRFTIAGQTYPEPSPYDRLILDRHVRFSGDAVAIIAAETEKAALQAMKVIKVKYQVLEAVLDMHTAKDNPILVHPEEDWYPPCRWAATTAATWWPAIPAGTATSRPSWRTATSCWTAPTTPRPSTRP